MTLYLVGRSSENTLVFASDGRSLSSDKREITSDNNPKIKVLDIGTVICYSGIDILVNCMCDLINHIGSSKAFQDTQSAVAYDFHKIFDQAFIEEIELEKLVKEFIKGVAQKAGTTRLKTDIQMFSFERDKPFASKLEINLEEPHLRTRYLRSDSPYYTGGVPVFSNDFILELVLNGQLWQGRDFLMGLFIYLMRETERVHEGVGGKYFLGELTSNGYRWFKEKEVLDGEEIAEEIRGNIESKIPMTVDKDKIQLALPIVKEVLPALNEADVLRRRAEKRLDSYNTTQEEKYNDTALVLLEFAVGLYSNGLEFQYGECPIYALLGTACMNAGRKEEAKKNYEKCLEIMLKTMTLESKTSAPQQIAIFRALKGLVNLGVMHPKNPVFMMYTIQMINDYGFTPDQLIAIR